MRSLIKFFLVLTIVLTLATGFAWAARHYKVLHAFGNGADGAGVWCKVVFDKQGNLYGSTSGGGAYGFGTVFELTPQPNGDWSESILHSFKNIDDPDGDEPTGGLIVDKVGNLYGTAANGGGRYAYGTVFKMKLVLGAWELHVLHRFTCNSTGTLCDPAGAPQSALLFDKWGNLYGAGGAVFELSPTPSGWQETILHSFLPSKGDGSGAMAAPTFDAAGNLYGTTEQGGTSKNCGGGCGTVFEIEHRPDGTWKESVLHSFNAQNDGAFPGFADKLAIDAAGNLYGTAGGGAGGHGVIFRMSRDANGAWKETVLHSIWQAVNGDGPSSGVVMDSAGNLYGTTIAGGDPNCDCGVVYKLWRNANNTWTYTVLHRFTGFDGAQPDANLTLDGKGNTSGTTATGGAGGAGVVFEITP